MTEPHFATPKKRKTPPKNAQVYHYGFNGKEKTDEMFGEGSDVDFGDRFVDTRVGRWWGVDKLANKYPWNSPYHFCNNNPVIYTDNDGNKIIVGAQDQEQFKTQLVQAFGEQAMYDFNFNEKGELQFCGDPFDYPAATVTVLAPVLELVATEQVIKVYYQKEIPAEDNKGKPGGTTDKFGGEATSYNPATGEVHIFIDPAENADFYEGDIEVNYYLKDKAGNTTENPREAMKDEYGAPAISTETHNVNNISKVSKYSRIFHGLGHAYGNIKGKPKAYAIQLENAARAIKKTMKINSKGSVSSKLSPEKRRPSTDKLHPK